MLKSAGLVCTSLFLLFAAGPNRDKFTKYQVVEAYEIRPGILVMPTYAEDGQVCQIGIERRHYSPGLIRLDSDMPRDVIDQIVDELVPLGERGPKSRDFLGGELIDEAGPGMTTTSLYENVSIYISSRVLSTSRRHGTVVEDVAATIKWNKRKCQ